MRFGSFVLGLALIAVAPGSGFARSPDARVAVARSALLLAVDRAGETVLAAGEHGVLLRSTDGGEHWEVPASGTLKTFTDVHVAPDGKEAWVVGHDELVLHSTDAGASWQVQNDTPEHDNPLLDVYFTDAQHGLAVGGYGVIYRTDDGGHTWAREVITGGDGFEYNFYGVTRAPSGTWFLVGEQGRLLRSRDGARTWEPLESPYPGSYFGVVAPPQGGVIAYGMLGNAYRSDDDGQTWQRLELPVEQSLLGSRIGADGRVYLVGRAGILLESADGRTFSRVPAGTRRVHTGLVEAPGGGLLVVGERGVRVVK